MCVMTIAAQPSWSWRRRSFRSGQLLVALLRHGPQRISQLGGLVGISQGTASTLAEALVRDGLIERPTDPRDGRAGQERARAWLRDYEAAAGEVFAVLLPGQCRALLTRCASCPRGARDHRASRGAMMTSVAVLGSGPGHAVGELGARGDLKFLERVGEVGLDGAQRDVELLGDLPGWCVLPRPGQRCGARPG